MKANRKILKKDDEAVSPVIAVILMVAITVVLAATVYVWVSGFNTGTSSTRSISFTSGGALSDTASQDTKEYVVASASPGFKWTDVNFTLDGSTLGYGSGADDRWCLLSSGSCAAGASGLIEAGQTIRVYDTALSSQTLRAVDVNGNSVLATIVVS